MQQTHFRFPEPMVAQLRQLAVVRDESVSAIVRAAVAQYLERAEQPRAAASEGRRHGS